MPRWEFRTEFVLISLVFAFFTLALSLGLGMVIDRPLSVVLVRFSVRRAVGRCIRTQAGFTLRIDSTLRQLLSLAAAGAG